jgi:hypothetical protein
MKKKIIVCGIVSVFLIFLLTGFAVATNEKAPFSSTQGNQWNYSQEIIVNDSAGKTLTDYPVSVCLNSSNFNFSKAKNDGSDIRFFSGNKTLNFWIETWSLENQEATIWVDVPSLPANGNCEVIMKYGNSKATSTSNGKKTFDFFDSFDGDTLSNLDWNAKGNGGGTVKVENGICEILAPTIHAHDSSIIYSRGNFGINSIFVIKRMKVTTGTDNNGPLLQQGFMDQLENRGNEIKHETEFANESRVSWEAIYKGQRQNSYDITDASVPEGNWYVSGVAWFIENNTRKIEWFKDGVRDPKMDFASNDYITNSPMHVYLYAVSNPDSSNNTGYMAVDYALVRKFVGTEPTVNVVPAQTESNVSIEKNDSTKNTFSNTSSNTSINTTSNMSNYTTSNTSENFSENISGSATSGGENPIIAPDTEFPKYNVNISGIKLSSPYRFDFPTLVKELDSSGINTIFLIVDTKAVWQCERFVKMAHKEGFSVHAVLFEDKNCSEKEAPNACQDSLNAVLDYNRKSIAPFDGISIFISPASKESSEDTIDYSKLIEAIRQNSGKNITLSASIPPYYPASKVKKISPFVDLFIVRAHCGGVEELNSATSIIDAIAPQMGEIRGAGSKGLIEITADKGFEDRVSIQKLFADIADYYSNDPAFQGVTICDYNTYTRLPVKADPNKNESQIPGLPRLPELPELPKIPGFSVLSMLIVLLGAYAILNMKRK